MILDKKLVKEADCHFRCCLQSLTEKQQGHRFHPAEYRETNFKETVFNLCIHISSDLRFRIRLHCIIHTRQNSSRLPASQSWKRTDDPLEVPELDISYKIK